MVVRVRGGVVVRVRGGQTITNEYGYMCMCVGIVQEGLWRGLGTAEGGIVLHIQSSKLNICDTMCNQTSIVNTLVTHALTIIM